jgi:hypothetical protein
MILDNILLLAAVIAVVWFVCQWGVLICALYAVWHFVMGEWPEAGMALCLGLLLEFLTSARGRRWFLWYFAFHSFALPRDRWWR